MLRWWGVDYLSINGDLADVVLENSRDAGEVMDRLDEKRLIANFARPREVRVSVAPFH